MIDLVETQTTPTIAIRSTFALAVGAAIMGNQFQYPKPAEAYEVQQVSGSYSAFKESLQTGGQVSEAFAQSMATIYSSLAARQEPFGTEFEAAIFDDIEDLYEV
jgi:hypothetical protein